MTCFFHKSSDTVSDNMCTYTAVCMACSLHKSSGTVYTEQLCISGYEIMPYLLRESVF